MGDPRKSSWKETAAIGLEVIAGAVGQAAQIDALLGNDFGKYDTTFSAGDAYSEQRRDNDEDDRRKVNAATKLQMILEMERLREAMRSGPHDASLRGKVIDLQRSYRSVGHSGFLERQYNQRFKDASEEFWDILKLENSMTVERKRAIVREAANVAQQTDVRAASAAMRKLREQFKSGPTAGRDEGSLRDAFEQESRKLQERSRAEAEARQAERVRKQQEYQARQAERERKQKEWEARQAERARKQQEYQARQAERERKQKEWEARQAERARKQQEYQARQAERARKQQEYQARQAERARKQAEYLARKSFSPRSGGQARSIFDPFGPRSGKQAKSWF